MKNKFLALFLAVLMMFSLFCAPVAFAAEEATTSVSTVASGDTSDIIGGTIGDSLKDKQDEAQNVIDTGYAFTNSLLSFIEKIQQLIIKFMDIFMVFVD